MDLNPLLSLCLAVQPTLDPRHFWSAWSLAPAVVLPLLLAAGLYGLAMARARPAAAPIQPWQAACFAAGWLLLAAAVVSPLCRMAATLASAHMLQHLILVALAPPLLILGAPWAALRTALPTRLRTAAEDIGAAGIASRLRAPTTASALYAAAIWFWHVPLFYEAALLNEAAHLSMYAVLTGTGLLFWGSLISAARRGAEAQGAAAIAMLSTVIHTGLLAALLTFAASPWYPLLAAQSASWGLTPLQDQQLAGLIMWVPMGFIYLAGALWMMAAWLRAVGAAGQIPDSGS